MLDCTKFCYSCFALIFLSTNNKSVMTKWLKHPYLWFQSVFNKSACNCCGGAVCIIGKTHEAPQQVFRLLFYSLSYFIGAAGFLLSKVLAAREKNLLVLAKINTLLTCSQMLAKTILYTWQCITCVYYVLDERSFTKLAFSKSKNSTVRQVAEFFFH